MVRLATIEAGQWDDFLKNSPQATIFHTLEWLRLWQLSFPRTRVFFIIQKKGTSITQALPVAEVKKYSFLSYYSLPQGCYGSVLVRTGVPDGCSELLHQFVTATRHYSGMIQLVDFHSTIDGSLLSADGFEKLTATTHILPLVPEPEQIWRNRIASKVRNQIRQSERHGVIVRPVKTPEDIALCFEIETATVQRHKRKGLFRYQFFRNLYETMGTTDRLHWTIAERDDQPLAYAIYLAYNDTVLHWTGGSFTDRWELRPNNALMWEAIQWACKQNNRFFNFGGSPKTATGLVHFKEGFGGKEKAYPIYQKVSRRFRLAQRIRRTF